jgi:hypothetical protein
VLPLLHQVRLQIGLLLKICPHAAGGDVIHDAPLYGLIGKLDSTPVPQRPARLVGRSFTSHSHYLAKLLGRESLGRSAARPVGERLLYRLARLPLRSLLRRAKPLFVLQPYPAPS